MTPELKLKRGDSAVHFVKLPIAMYQAGMNVCFMVKPAAALPQVTFEIGAWAVGDKGEKRKGRT